MQIFVLTPIHLAIIGGAAFVIGAVMATIFTVLTVALIRHVNAH